MKFILRFSLAIVLLAICLKGICSDSSYIHISWNGPVGKPFYEFVFYKKGGFNPDQDQNQLFHGGNPFVLQIAVSDIQFQKLKYILFANYNNPDSSDHADRLFMSYYIGYFEGSKWILSNYMNNKADLLKTCKEVTSFFQGTMHEAVVKQHWEFLFSRVGI